MPTPFMHLQFAEEMRLWIGRGDDTPLQHLLGREWSAFYLGSVAPDFQTICNVPRADTHFYNLPPGPDDEAFSAMLARYPELAMANSLSPARATFVAAYAVHLVLDLLWFREVLIPYFMEASRWGDFPQRRLVHHILLTYLDKLAFDSLPKTAASILAAAHPHNWLAFASDEQLINWRELLVTQLQPGATLQTVEIYAGRLGMSPSEFAHKLHDPEWIDTQVFSNVPVAEIQAKFKAVLPLCVDLITDYLNES